MVGWGSIAYSQGDYAQGQSAVFSGPTFSALQFFQKPQPTLLVLMKTDKASPACRQNISTFAKLSKELNEARGFNVVFQKSSQVVFQRDPMLLQDQVVDAGAKMGADATLLVYWARKSDDRLGNDGSAETVNLDEEAQYEVWNVLKIKDLPAVVQHQDVMDGDEFEEVEKQVLFRIYQDTGSQYPTRSVDRSISQVTNMLGERKEIRIQCTGLRNLSQLQKIREMFFNEFKDLVVLEPREFSKGTAIYSVETSLSADELQKKLGSMQHEMNDISPVLKMEVRVVTE